MSSNKRHLCEECGKVCINTATLKEHKRSHTGEKPYSCLECGKTFGQLKGLSYHKKTHANERNYMCEECGKAFYQKSSLKIHKRIHTGEKSYKCPICNKGFAQSNNLKRHKKSHEKEIYTKIKKSDGRSCDINNKLETNYENAQQIECEYCGMQFYFKTELIQHFLIHGIQSDDIDGENELQETSEKFVDDLENHEILPTNELTYECEICLKSFNSQTLLIEHINIMHNKKKLPFHCVWCKKDFNTLRSLNRHKKVHTMERPYKCEICQVSFNNPNTLDNHNKSKHTEINSPHVCVVCEKVFVSIKRLNQHTKSHERPHQCSVCSKSFGSSYEVLRHTRVMHKEEYPALLEKHKIDKARDKNNRDKLSFECDVCGKIFPKLKRLNMHKKIHTDEKPHGCFECPKSFRTTSELKRHIKTHTGETPFKCDICQKAFPEAYDVTKHKRIHIKNYSCDLCDEKFKHSDDLLSHSRIHTGENLYKCEICCIGFNNPELLAGHKSYRHNSKLSSTCKVCGLVFDKPSDLMNHKIIHTGKKFYECYVCAKLYLRLNDLIRHVKFHDEAKLYQHKVYKSALLINDKDIHGNEQFKEFKDNFFECDNCEMKFRIKKNLKNHLQIHGFNIFENYEQTSPEINGTVLDQETKFEDIPVNSEETEIVKADNLSKCNDCGKSLHSLIDVGRNENTVENISKCPECENSLEKRILSNEDNYTHDDEEPQEFQDENFFECNTCQMKFKLENNLKKHLKTHENNVDDFDEETSSSIDNQEVNFGFEENCSVKSEETENNEADKLRECNDCGTSYYGSVDLIKNDSTDENIYKCPKCKQAPEQFDQFNEDKNVPDNAKSDESQDKNFFKCDHCKKKFKLEKNLLKHLEIHEVKENNINEQTFSTEVSSNNNQKTEIEPLKKHSSDLSKHKNEKPEEVNFVKKLHKCKDCKKPICFSIVDINSNDSTEESIYKCLKCEKNFVQYFRYKSKNIKNINKSQNKNFIFCDFCKKRFKYKKSLIKHLEIHELKSTTP